MYTGSETVNYQLRYSTSHKSCAIPLALNDLTSSVAQAFYAQQDALKVEGGDEYDEISSDVELLSLFMRFLATWKPKHDAPRHDKDHKGQLLHSLLSEFERAFLNDRSIHELSLSLFPSEANLRRSDTIVRNYCNVRALVNRRGYTLDIASSTGVQSGSNLFTASENGDAILGGVFGGQGHIAGGFYELRKLYETYSTFLEPLIVNAAVTLEQLCSQPSISKSYANGLNVKAWLSTENSPSEDYLTSAPVSFPLITLLQLANFAVSCFLLGKSPGQVLDLMESLTGHSQGILTAVAIASSNSWSSFEAAAMTILTISLSIGCRSQQVFDTTEVPLNLIENSIANGEGQPTPMLSIVGLDREIALQQIEKLNRTLPKGSHVHVSLFNDSKNTVVSGTLAALCALNTQLRQIQAAPTEVAHRVRFSLRKPQFTTSFLPITAPFHSPYLASALPLIMSDLEEVDFTPTTLRVPVYDTRTGADLRDMQSSDFLSEIVNLVVLDQVHWDKVTTKFLGKLTHVIDFGPGELSGIGPLTVRSKAGSGIRLIVAGRFQAPNQEYGGQEDLYARNASHRIKYGDNWGEIYGPALVNVTGKGTMLNTRLTRLLNLPHIMVGGMTPTTVWPEFVAAIMNAGYYAELACGGYNDEESLRSAITTIQKAVTPGRGITCNIIYASPKSVAWQIKLLRKLKAEGKPVKGLCVGAGVPSADIANDWITTLGLEYISFKPGTVDSINAVITIAKANPTFPIILQWTGGRGGGHHSCEDMHQPILQTYGAIRQNSNVILVAGSGFGAVDDSWPYILGSWSHEFGRASMPFDGIMVGSRVMTALEAKTSLPAKQLIVDTPGMRNETWEETYNNSSSILTVRSEMGESIHKIATRGVKLWADLDRTVFSLPVDKRALVLETRRHEIIKRLNEDFQKVWFGRNSSGTAVEVHEMSYFGVLQRMIDLMYIGKLSRWIDKSYPSIVADFFRRLEETFTNLESDTLLDSGLTELTDPREFLKLVAKAYPQSQHTRLSYEDVQYFLHICRISGRKPVPFVPILDENLETWFKKDSLWQSEFIEAVPDQDVGRVCILHGPVSVHHSNEVNVPVKDILDSIVHGHVDRLMKAITTESKNETCIPNADYLTFETSTMRDQNSMVKSGTHGNRVSVEIPHRCGEDVLPNTEEWFQKLAGTSPSWHHAVFTTKHITRDDSLVANPVLQIFHPRRGLHVEMEHNEDSTKRTVRLFEFHQEKMCLIEVAFLSQPTAGEIEFEIYENRTADGSRAVLEMPLTYYPGRGFAAIGEVSTGRIARITKFYEHVWYGSEALSSSAAVSSDVFTSQEMPVSVEAVKKFIDAVEPHSQMRSLEVTDRSAVPLDYAMVIAWNSIMRCLFVKELEVDFLRLLHLSNEFCVRPNVDFLKVGDTVKSVAHIRSIMNEETGKKVEVRAEIIRDEQSIIEVTSVFFFRGAYEDSSTTFTRKMEELYTLSMSNDAIIEMVRNKPWFFLEDEDIDLRGSQLEFKLETHGRGLTNDSYDSIKVFGEVVVKSPLNGFRKNYRGHVLFETTNSANLVLDFLMRRAQPVQKSLPLATALPLKREAQNTYIAPASNEVYAVASGDYNPIHVSASIAALAGLKSPITHGMLSSAMTRQLAEKWLCGPHEYQMIRFKCSFAGMVLPDDEMSVDVSHVAMALGNMVVSITATNKRTGEVAVLGEAEVSEANTAYLFTGQGSQEQGMGMELYETSDAARQIWDRADKHMQDTYGIKITDIVRHNPKELTVHFGGQVGRAIRANYMALSAETVDVSGQPCTERIFQDITESTRSYTFKSPSGLLHQTQFAQPALTLMENAIFADMKTHGVVGDSLCFAGHSLGEYSALAAVADVFPIETLVTTVFYRGLTMQRAVERDETGRSSYGMCAVNPGRIGKGFTESHLQTLVEIIGSDTGTLLQIVNYNVEGSQYVCAGHLSALCILQKVTDHLNKQPFRSHPRDIDLHAHLSSITKTHASTMTNFYNTSHVQERGVATIPLQGIDVPFHSRFLAPGVTSFRKYLRAQIDKDGFKLDRLLGRYVPNVAARPLTLEKNFVEDIYKSTGSDALKSILESWDEQAEERLRRLKNIAHVTNVGGPSSSLHGSVVEPVAVF